MVHDNSISILPMQMAIKRLARYQNTKPILTVCWHHISGRRPNAKTLVSLWEFDFVALTEEEIVDFLQFLPKDSVEYKLDLTVIFLQEVKLRQKG